MRRTIRFAASIALLTLLWGAGAGDVAMRPQIYQTAAATTLLNPYLYVSAGDLPDHWWKLNESAGATTCSDSGSATAIDCSITGSVCPGTCDFEPTKVFNSTWTGAYNRSSVTSSSADNKGVELDSNPDLDGLTKLSICMWLNADDNQGYDMRWFSQADGWSEDDHVFMVGYRNSGNVIRSRIGVSGNTTTYVSSEVFPGYEDVHYCFVLDFAATNELKLYKNGNSTPVWDQAVAGTELDDSHVTGTIVTLIGAQPYSGKNVHPVEGHQGDVRLFLNKALTTTEVSAIYNNTF